jgi:hypothetical protein
MGGEVLSAVVTERNGNHWQWWKPLIEDEALRIVLDPFGLP